MPQTDRHGRPIIVAGDWFGKLPARPRKLNQGEWPRPIDEPSPNEPGDHPASPDRLQQRPSDHAREPKAAN